MRTIGRQSVQIVNAMVLACVMAGSAGAECVTAAQWQAKVEKASKELQVIDAAELPDEIRDTVAGFYNETPPAHDPIMPAKAVQLISKSRKFGLPFPYVLFGFFNGHDCLIGMFQMPISTGRE